MKQNDRLMSAESPPVVFVDRDLDELEENQFQQLQPEEDDDDASRVDSIDDSTDDDVEDDGDAASTTGLDVDIASVAQSAAEQDCVVGDGPLRCPWILYGEFAKQADQRQQAVGYAKSKLRVMKINSVADFWATMHNVAPPSLLSMNSMYQLFRQGVQPEWEDPANAQGHSFEFGVDCKLGDKLWIEFAIGAIGENLPFADEIVGIFIKLREKGPRVGFWLTTRTHERVQAILKELSNAIPEAHLRPLMIYDHAAELQKFSSAGSSSHPPTTSHSGGHGRGRGGPPQAGGKPHHDGGGGGGARGRGRGHRGGGGGGGRA